jgi:hypothetical protein
VRIHYTVMGIWMEVQLSAMRVSRQVDRREGKRWPTYPGVISLAKTSNALFSVSGRLK